MVAPRKVEVYSLFFFLYRPRLRRNLTEHLLHTNNKSTRIPTTMYETVKSSNVSRTIIGDFISLFHAHYRKLKLMNISLGIREYVYTKSHFASIYHDLEKQAAFRGAARSISYFTMPPDQTLHKPHRQRNPSNNDD